MQPIQPKNKKFMWVSAALISLLVISNVAWGWMYSEGRNNLQQQLDSANKNLDKKQADSTVTKETKATTPKIASKSSFVQYREIPELGVKYVANDRTKDLTYSYSHYSIGSSVGFSTITLANGTTADKPGNQIYTGQDANSSNSPLGSWQKFAPNDIFQRAASPDSGAKISEVAKEAQFKDKIKKVGNFYIAWFQPQNAISEDPTIVKQQEAGMSAVKAALASLQPVN